MEEEEDGFETVKAKKNKKQQKEKKDKKKKKNQGDDPEEDPLPPAPAADKGPEEAAAEESAFKDGSKPEEEKKEVDNEEEEEKKGDGGGGAEFPIEVYYCALCDSPPEYCEFTSKDIKACKESLLKADEDLYEELFGGGEGAEEEGKAGAGGKKKKKKGAVEEKKEVHVTILKRGGKKHVTMISGLHTFDVSLKDASKALGKRFACGNSVVEEKEKGQSIQLGGELSEEQFVECVKELFPQVDTTAIKFEEGGNKKKARK